ncbi:sigma-70 family RNA polymerase sigma factor [Nocardia sp. NPDC005825]|uniref:RNA polymerase sigma factor n=1 Tax=unclassified Nocardia TaxID=2637762 RepID=UPI0033DCF6E4
MAEDIRDERVRELVSSCVHGSPEAWRILVDAYSPLVWTIIASFRLSKHDSEDIYQSTWVNVVRHLGALRAPESLKAWLTTTTRRECLKHTATETGRLTAQPDDVSEFADQYETVADHVARIAAVRDVRAALRRLPARDQLLLETLMTDAAPSYDRVSAQLGVPRGSIGPLRGRALNRLRALLPPDAASWVA